MNSISCRQNSCLRAKLTDHFEKFPQLLCNREEYLECSVFHWVEIHFLTQPQTLSLPLSSPVFPPTTFIFLLRIRLGSNVMVFSCIKTWALVQLYSVLFLFPFSSEVIIVLFILIFDEIRGRTIL